MWVCRTQHQMHVADLCSSTRLSANVAPVLPKRTAYRMKTIHLSQDSRLTVYSYSEYHSESKEFANFDNHGNIVESSV